MRPQVDHFLNCELERKIFRETAPITAKLLIQPLGRDAVERGEIAIEDDLLAADFVDQVVNSLSRER